MQIEQLLPVDDLSGAVDAGRRSLGRIDLSGIPAALAAIPGTARDTIPGPWARPRNRWRWPLVGVLLVLATAVVGMVVVGPALRRREPRHKAWDASPDDTLTYSAEPPRAAPATLEPDPSAALPPNVMAYVVEE